MKTPSNNDDYQIVITKPNKYKRSNEWTEYSGELSPVDIEAIIYYDRLDSEIEQDRVFSKISNS